MNASALNIFDIIAKSFVGGGFILTGLFLFYLFLKYFFKSKASLHWKQVKGEILVSEYFTTLMGDAPTVDYRIKYKYIINDIEYLGNRIYFRTIDGDSTNYMKKYKIGKEVLVHYNPKNINESVLEVGLGYNLYALIIIGLFSITIGMLIIMYA